MLSTARIVFVAIVMCGLASQAAAQTLETESARVLPRHVWEFGYAVEAQTSSEGTEQAMPFAIVYGITGRLELMVEPVPYTSIRPKAAPHAAGAGDIESTLTYRFHEEGPRLPAFAVAGEVKVPTARNAAIGTGETDYAAYFTESKHFGRFDTHAHVSYTFVGQPSQAPLGDIVGFGLATVFTATPRFDLFGEVLGNSASTPGGEGGTGTPLVAVPEAAGGELVATVGGAWRTKPWLTVYVSGSRDNIGAILWRVGFVIRSGAH